MLRHVKCGGIRHRGILLRQSGGMQCLRSVYNSREKKKRLEISCIFDMEFMRILQKD